MRSRTTMIPFALLIASACTPSAPAGLSDADKTAIEAHDQSFAKLAIAGDYGALAKAYYTDDAIVLAPNAPSASGAAAIEALMKTFPPITSMTLHTAEVSGSGDSAWGRGTYQMVMAPPGAPAVPDSGKWIEIYKKQADGSWKSMRDMFSSDLPAEAPAPVPKKAAKK